MYTWSSYWIIKMNAIVMKLLEFIVIPLCDNPIKGVFFFFIPLSPGEAEQLSKITQVLHNWTRNFARLPDSKS